MYTHLADFIPGVDPYDVATMVEFYPTAEGVRMVLTVDAMHDDQGGGPEGPHSVREP